MVLELEKKDYGIAQPFFTRYTYQLPALSVLEGSFPGRVFVDSEQPTIALAWTISRWGYLSGGPAPGQEQFLREVLQELKPIAQAGGQEYLELYTDRLRNWDILFDAVSGCKATPHDENTFVLNRKKFDALELPIPDGLEARLMEFEYIPQCFVPFLSPEEQERTLTGIGLFQDGVLRSRCLHNGFALGDRYYVGIRTEETGERCKGYGTYAAYLLIQEMFRRGLTPLWETMVCNTPSQRVAAKLGFEITETYPVYAIEGI